MQDWVGATKKFSALGPRRNMSTHRMARTSTAAAPSRGRIGTKTLRPSTCQAASGDWPASCRAQRAPSSELDIAAEHSKYQALQARLCQRPVKALIGLIGLRMDFVNLGLVGIGVAGPWRSVPQQLHQQGPRAGKTGVVRRLADVARAAHASQGLAVAFIPQVASGQIVLQSGVKELNTPLTMIQQTNPAAPGHLPERRGQFHTQGLPAIIEGFVDVGLLDDAGTVHRLEPCQLHEHSSQLLVAHATKGIGKGIKAGKQCVEGVHQPLASIDM